MDLIIKTIAFILKLLIFIGDGVLFPFKSFTILNKPKKRKNKRKKTIKIHPKSANLIKIKYLIAGSIISLIFVFIPLLVIIFLQELPNPKQLSYQYAPLTTKIYDKNNNLLYQIYANQNRTLVSLSSIPKNLINATIAIEDKNFYKNSGIDTLAIIRSAIADITGKPLQGGSTITQQLIKSTLLTPEISISRKIKEIILAIWAEKLYTKNQILEMYLNNVPYGGTAWGAETAAQTYFGKSVTKLNLAESAFLAGLPQAPSLYSPYGEDPKLWKNRQKDVLNRMRDLGYITKIEQANAEKQELAILPLQTPLYAPHFVMYVKDLLIKKYGLPLVEKGGLKVITTLDLKLQTITEDIVNKEVEKSSYLNLTNGAALVTNPQNGDILAMVGSSDYNKNDGGNYNVTTGLRQPGSSIKPVTYSAALAEEIMTPATIIDDSPITYNFPGSPPYSPVNYDGKFHGRMTLRNALGNSVNIPAVKVLSKIGIPAMINLGKKMGITTWNDSSNYGLSITLGSAEVKMTDMATVYGVLANGGYRVDLNPFEKVTDSQGNVLEDKKNISKNLVLSPETAFIISDILADNNARSIAFGYNSPLNIPNRKVSVKTGTSDNKRDNWTIGYTPSFVTAVWVGNNDNSPMSPIFASGITGAAPIWNKIMSTLISTSFSERKDIPQNLVKKLCFGKQEYFIRGTENSVNCIWKPTPTPTPNH